MEQMPAHIYDKGNGFMPDLMPWSQKYLQYEADEKANLVMAAAPPGNTKPRTPSKGKRAPQLA